MLATPALVLAQLPAHFGGDEAPARGADPAELIPATLIALAAVAFVTWAAWRYRRGHLRALGRMGEAVERVTGLPPWAGVSIGTTTVGLLLAVSGFYWDVSWHIDKGRDPGPFANPAHWLIIFGLAGIALAGALALTLDTARDPSGVRLPRLGRVTVGGSLLLLCGGIALLGFPLDDEWHRIFGQDVTLWGPTHVQMVGGASLATLASWVLFEEGRRRARVQPSSRVARWVLRSGGDVLIGGAFLVGMSTLQGEFDFGVPQFRAIYHPVLIMLAAGVALVATRVRGGRGAAVGAALFFIALRGLLALVIGPGLGRSTLHFPLYLAEALLVELAAVLVPRGRQVTMGLVSGLLLGTAGLAAEWGWSHLWMPLPWRAALWPEAAILGFVAAVAGSLLGALAGRSLLPVGAARQDTPRFTTALAWAGAFTVIALALPMTYAKGSSATVTLRTVSAGAERTVIPTVRVTPAATAAHPAWFVVSSWQGGDGEFSSHVRGQVIAPLHQTAPGVYTTDRPVPVYGKWKTMVRLGTLDGLSAVPVYLPADPAIPAPQVPASDRFTRPFQPDKKILQREQVGGSPGLQRGAYLVLLAIGLAWIASLGFGLRRLDRLGAAPEAALPGGPAAPAALDLTEPQPAEPEPSLKTPSSG